MFHFVCPFFLFEQAAQAAAAVNSDVLSDGKYRIWSGELTWREVRMTCDSKQFCVTANIFKLIRMFGTFSGK